MQVESYINDRFILDDGSPAGVLALLWGGKFDRHYIFEDKRCETREEAEAFIKNYDAEMVERPEKDVGHPIPNRR